MAPDPFKYNRPGVGKERRWDSDRDEMNEPVPVCVRPGFEGTGWFFDELRSYC